MNVDQLLAMRRCETFTVEGIALNVVLADAHAWSALEAVLGGDSIEAWSLKGMQHVYENKNDRPRVAFKAEFVRKPDDED